MTDAGTIRPAAVLQFWRDAGPERWFTLDEAFDSALKARFFGLWERAAAGGLSTWEESDDGALALVIVLDQFPRNMFRNHASAFASDALARAVARRAIDRGADRRIEQGLRAFLYMPFMHSEDPADQATCVALFQALGDANNLRYAEMHADIIGRFGRFPHRNRILNRATTPDEQSFLDSGGFSG